MSGFDFEELFQSPLDEPPQPSDRAWHSAIIGLMVGLIGASLLVALVGTAGDESEEASPTTVGAPTADVFENVVPVAPDYPTGFVEFVAGIAAKPTELVVGEASITLALTTVVKRDADPLAADWPLGGKWHLETPAGIVTESSRVILGRFSPGAFAVEFPSAQFAGDVSFARTTMVERWDHIDIAGSVDMPFGGEPFVAPDPVTIRLTDDVSLTIPMLKLGRFLGSVEWELRGTGPAGGRVVVDATLLDSLGTEIGSYSSFPALLDPSTRGVIEITWQEPFPTSQEGAVAVVLNYSVALVKVVATDVDIDLAAVPLGR